MTLMSGLTAAGKDPWIATHGGDEPVIPLDDLRRRERVSPTDRAGQSRIVVQAQEQARVFLRAGQDFTWNATNVTQETRARLISLAASYSARVRIVAVERDPSSLRAANSQRPTPVPEAVVDRLLRRWEPPTLVEAHQLDLIDAGD
jgi:predicted kinase